MMRAMVLDRPKTPLDDARAAGSAAGRRRDSGRDRRRAASAAPICTWSTANCRIRSCRSCRDTRSSAASRRSGPGVDGFALGERVGVPWLGATCGVCPYCRSGRENLCDAPLFTGYTRDGGYATHTLADARFCFPLPEALDAAEAAPLLCAGLIGWRSYRMAGEGEALGLYGFGAAAHILAQVAVWQGRRVYAFTRSGDAAAQDFARSLGAVWAGGSDEMPPEPLDAAIIFAPVGALVPAALAAVKKGGRVVCGGIHMSDIPSFPYRLLWEERQLLSVANLTPPGCLRISGHRAAGRHQDASHALSARTGEYRARRSAPRPF